jgi:hypothetical protein
MRSYDINITDENDHVVAFFSKLDEAQMVSILTTIVPTRGNFISVHILLEFDRNV